MGLLSWFTGRKEQRSALKDPDSWLKSAFSGSPTGSGEKVTTETALQQPAVFACVRVISEDLASLPCKVYKRLGNGRESIESHPIARLLQKSPNPEMTPFTFKETLTGHILLWGNAYAEIERNGAGQPVALWPLMPDKMQLKIVDHELIYIYDNRLIFSSDKILHIKGLGTDGIQGYSPIAYARETIGISQALERSGATFFANSSRPAGILTHPARLSEDAARRLRQTWDSMYSGSKNVGRTAILEEAMQWESVSIPNSDAQWIEARQLAMQDIARIYRVPPHLIGDLSHATFSNIESQQISYLQQTLMPWVRRWEQELTKKLIVEDDIYVEFLAEEILRGNTSDRYDAYKVARESGWLSVNEIRQRENLNPIPDGDTYIQPLNFTTMGSEEQEDEVPTRAWLDECFSRSVSVIKNSTVRKANTISNSQEWNTWVSEQKVKLRSKVIDIITPPTRYLENYDANHIADTLLEQWENSVSNCLGEEAIRACDTWSTDTRIEQRG
jgi:HK97 family phage portal protein